MEFIHAGEKKTQVVFVALFCGWRVGWEMVGCDHTSEENDLWRPFVKALFFEYAVEMHDELVLDLRRFFLKVTGQKM